jgi:hypothetical protein
MLRQCTASGVKYSGCPLFPLPLLVPLLVPWQGAPQLSSRVSQLVSQRVAVAARAKATLGGQRRRSARGDTRRSTIERRSLGGWPPACVYSRGAERQGRRGAVIQDSGGRVGRTGKALLAAQPRLTGRWKSGALEQ